MSSNKLIIITFTTILLLNGCAIIEQSIEENPEKVIPVNPVLAVGADSAQVFKAVSSVQRSPEHLLAGYTILENGKYTCNISPTELKEIGLTEADYKEYLKVLAKLNDR